MAFMKLNGLVNSAMVAMSEGRGINELLKMLKENAENIELLSMNEKITVIIFVSLLGMAVTFAVLVFLWFALTVLSKFLSGAEKRTSKPSKVEKVETTVAEVVQEAEVEEDEELVAVIAAAVAASLNTSIHNIVVKNIVQVTDQSPSWAKTGRIEQMNTRF